MNRQTILSFGRRGFGHGSMTNYPGVLFKTIGVAGIIQPYNMYVPDHVNNPYIQKTLLTSPKPDDIQKNKKLVSTEYMKGHGKAPSAQMPADQTSDSTPKEAEKEIVAEKEITTQQATTDQTTSGDSEALSIASNSPVKITEKQFKRKLEALESKEVERKTPKKHKFSLI